MFRISRIINSKNNKKGAFSHKKRAFSFIELAIVIAIIGALAGGIIGGTKLTEMAALNGARSTTITSPVSVLDGLVLWLDTTSRKSFSETEAVSGGAISTWYDINPKLNDPINFTQSTAAQKPTYTLKAIGRLPALAFTDDVMSSSSVNIDRIISETGEITIFVVTKNDVTANSYFHGFIFFWTGGANRVGFDFANPSLYFNYGICCGTDARINGSVASHQLKWAIYAGIRKSDTATIRVNGANLVGPTASSITPIAHTSTTAITIGSGTNGTGVNRLVGSMAEIIIFNRGLSASEVSEVETYLSQKWKIRLQ